jgi:hypothetical protein
MKDALPRLAHLLSQLVVRALLMSDGVTGELPLPPPTGGVSAAGRMTLSRRIWESLRRIPVSASKSWRSRRCCTLQHAYLVAPHLSALPSLLEDRSLLNVSPREARCEAPSVALLA